MCGPRSVLRVSPDGLDDPDCSFILLDGEYTIGDPIHFVVKANCYSTLWPYDGGSYRGWISVRVKNFAPYSWHYAIIDISSL